MPMCAVYAEMAAGHPREGGSQHLSIEVARSVNAGAIFARRLLGMLDLWLAAMPNGHTP
jgi:hypothetical protein